MADDTNPVPTIYACSGAADVGAISDRAARTLTKEGCGAMSCLAGVGGRVSSHMDRARNASRILVIDGCVQCCASQCLEEAGFQDFESFQLGEIGLEKGSSPPDDRIIEAAVTHSRKLLKR
jgi:uncharacterized metal-binding protein